MNKKGYIEVEISEEMGGGSYFVKPSEDELALIMAAADNEKPIPGWDVDAKTIRRWLEEAG